MGTVPLKPFPKGVLGKDFAAGEISARYLKLTLLINLQSLSKPTMPSKENPLLLVYAFWWLGIVEVEIPDEKTCLLEEQPKAHRFRVEDGIPQPILQMGVPESLWSREVPHIH